MPVRKTPPPRRKRAPEPGPGVAGVVALNQIVAGTAPARVHGVHHDEFRDHVAANRQELDSMVRARRDLAKDVVKLAKALLAVHVGLQPHYQVIPNDVRADILEIASRQTGG